MHIQNIPSDTTSIVGAYSRHSLRYNKYIKFVFLWNPVSAPLPPSPVRLCRSCLRRFGDLRKKHTAGFWNMYFVIFE